MKETTLNKYLTILQSIKDSGLSVNAYCKQNGLNPKNIYNTIKNIKEDTEGRTDLMYKILDIYAEVTGKEIIDTDDRANIYQERNEDGKIVYYSYEIFIKDKSPLIGKLSREEMATIYRLYSFYGDNLTRRIISRHFPDLSLVDFGRILRAFGITKASTPFPPHYLEEYTEQELREIQIREKENSFLRKAEEDAIRNNETLLKKYAKENLELKRKLGAFNSFEIDIPEIEAVKWDIKNGSDKCINLYLSDMHLGSYTTSGSIYKENRNYGFTEAKRRLTVILQKLIALGSFQQINLVLMGDNIDSCQFTGYTSRMDHLMPSNMDSREQANKFIELMMWFIESIRVNQLAENMMVYSVPCGNHSGTFEYLCNKALLSMIEAKYPDVRTVLWEEFYGIFYLNQHTWIILHGKDEKFMKKPFPLNLDDKTKTLLYEWLEEKQIHHDNVHFVKGDLHSNALSSCKRFTYRNVLSLYGASDYSNMNYSRNSYGLSYDLFVDDILLSGTFENI